MPTKKDGPPACAFCGIELKDGKCQECGGWTDSYGLFHRRECGGGFHEKCEGKLKS